MGIKKGDKIPSFTLENQWGEKVTVSNDDGQKKLIYFYPKNETKKCTEQACSFRDWQDDFVDAGYKVYGISSDSVSAHQRFHNKYNLNFTLLSDKNTAVRKQFGAHLFFGLLPSRKSFLVNENGEVTFIYEELFEGEMHVSKTLEALNKDNKD